MRVVIKKRDLNPDFLMNCLSSAHSSDILLVFYTFHNWETTPYERMGDEFQAYRGGKIKRQGFFVGQVVHFLV